MALCWTRHDDAGMSVQLPAGWRVVVEAPGIFSVCDPHGTAAALLRRRPVQPRVELSAWLQRHCASAEPGLHNVRLHRAAACGRHLAQAAFDYGGQLALGHAGVVARRERGTATLFIAAAARGEFGARLPLLARVLESVHLGGQAAAPGLELLPLLRIADTAD